MINDVVFKKKVFGGFDKDEVMSYINGLLSEKCSAETKLENANSSIAALNRRIRELEGEVAALSEAKSNNEALTESLEEEKKRVLQLTEELESANALKDKLAEEKAKNEALNAELSVYEAEGETTAELKARILALEAENARLKGMEQQVGAAMLDARVHSEELVREARERANKVTKEVYAAIGDTALKIDGLSSDIGEIARSFTKAAEEIELRINVLTGNMSKTAQALISDSVLSEASADTTSSTSAFVFEDNT